MLKSNLPQLDDEEGTAAPQSLPMVVDAHVHVFPPEIFAAIRSWFDEHAWRIRYQLKTSEVFEFLLLVGYDHGADRLFPASGSRRPQEISSGSGYVRIGFPQYSICMGPGAEVFASSRPVRFGSRMDIEQKRVRFFQFE
jgi:hypothetical protein